MEFDRIPSWQAILEAHLIRGDLSGLKQDIFDCFSVCSDEKGGFYTCVREAYSHTGKDERLFHLRLAA